MFQATLSASAEITERAAQLWCRIQSYVSEKGLTAQLLIKFEILTLCIAGVTLEYDRREREFASYLEILRSSCRSRGIRGLGGLPASFAEYRRAELRFDGGAGEYGYHLYSKGLIEHPERSQLTEQAEILTRLWSAVVFSYFPDFTILPLIQVETPDKPLSMHILCTDLLSPDNRQEFDAVSLSSDVLGFEANDTGFVLSLIDLNQTIERSDAVDSYRTKVSFQLK